MPSDLELKEEVAAELAFEPGLDEQGIEVSVRDGFVTLNGSVGSYAERLAAIRAAKRIIGVRGLAEDLMVKLVNGARRTDREIATAVNWATSKPTADPSRAIQVTVRNGWVTLTGVADSGRQKSEAEERIWNLVGVMGVTNSITIQPMKTSMDLKSAIRAALKRNALLADEDIQVEASGSKVILRGGVSSFFHRDQAEEIAKAAPGVTEVESRIVLII
jgi:osmotically-inducible protein OsmY